MRINDLGHVFPADRSAAAPPGRAADDARGRNVDAHAEGLGWHQDVQAKDRERDDDEQSGRLAHHSRLAVDGDAGAVADEQRRAAEYDQTDQAECPEKPAVTYDLTTDGSLKRR